MPSTSTWPTRARCSRSRPTWTPRVTASSTSTSPLRLKATGKSSSLNMTRTLSVSCCDTRVPRAIEILGLGVKMSFAVTWSTNFNLLSIVFTGHVSPPAVFATCTYSSYLFVCFLHDVKNVLKMYRLSSGEELRTFPLDVGSVVGFTGRKRDSEIFYYFTSFLSPGMRCNSSVRVVVVECHFITFVAVKKLNMIWYFCILMQHPVELIYGLCTR